MCDDELSGRVIEFVSPLMRALVNRYCAASPGELVLRVDPGAGMADFKQPAIVMEPPDGFGATALRASRDCANAVIPASAIAAAATLIWRLMFHTSVADLFMCAGAIAGCEISATERTLLESGRRERALAGIPGMFQRSAFGRGVTADVLRNPATFVVRAYTDRGRFTGGLSRLSSEG